MHSECAVGDILNKLTLHSRSLTAKQMGKLFQCFLVKEKERMETQAQLTEKMWWIC